MNKKRMLLPLLFFCMCSVANAQFHIGVKSGLNATKIDGQSFKENFEYNYLVGAFAEIGLSDKFTLNPEVLFSQTSTTLSDGANSSVF